MWSPPWKVRQLGALGYNPRQYQDVLGPESWAMRYWQNLAHGSRRDALKRLPRPVLETLFRRLRRWTYYRDIGGHRYYLLYRGVNPSEIAGVTTGSVVTFPRRTSYTVDASTAFQFANRYGTRAVGVWVPEESIISAPFAFGKEFNPDYNHGEIEIIVDPHSGILQDEKLDIDDFCGRSRTPDKCLFDGWMGRAGHPWFEAGQRQLDKMNRLLDAGKSAGHVSLSPLNPNSYRLRPPTSDSKTSRGF